MMLQHFRRTGRHAHQSTYTRLPLKATSERSKGPHAENGRSCPDCHGDDERFADDQDVRLGDKDSRAPRCEA